MNNLTMNATVEPMGTISGVLFDEYAHAFSVAVAAELHHERESRGISYPELVRETGISRASLSRKLAGTTPIELEELVRICVALRVDPFVLMRDIRVKLGQQGTTPQD